MIQHPSPEQFSHELKFVFPNHRAGLILNWLKTRCRTDGEYPAAIVSSIYYDTVDWQSLAEKNNSDYLKTKLRLRWYQDLYTGELSKESFLEVKFKVGGKRHKLRFSTGFGGAWLQKRHLNDSRLRHLLTLLNEANVPLNQAYYPVFQVSYKRFRFIDPISSARLCVDHDIHSPRVNRQIMPFCKPNPISKGVFECKGSHIELPNILHQLTVMGCKKESFSKYSVCHDHHLDIIR